MNHSPGLDAVLWILTQGIGNDVRVNCDDGTAFVPDHLIGLDHMGVAQADAFAEYKALVLLGGLLAKGLRVKLVF